ncbi:PREDICTED: phosphoinositide 3-kinase regulatory subunit 6 [Gavialis gangeticus]|uniref:phosphoinositide 3-kinase regulatory subunit 6 n=1 Tax=Gavialis gangeticus TaxID=94835 RepID=UPI00092E77E3|nr:PREDICTED: phosphoinositide 3-kinase regulatory subunit 6 [Gavialis gangeticus]XP_019357597.1 PREDICTED: phosphoinositide 3-kinase regulatory subunit 6 [Gavialis gangeticus]XP_019357606.1 PREDICTED: phosphoinositide 3-kinase regulatory subunit 6 [Gavialis gangeticus]
MENTGAESDILRSVHALLRELDRHHPAFQNERGMLRWTLHKKTDRNPGNSTILAKILVKELERAERGDYRHYIIPLLHTLMYTLIKAPCFSDDLYGRIYDFCKKLLTLPKPYCTIGLDYACRLKTERVAPGVLYQRMVISEQSLRSDPYPYQEKVFIFADPDLLSKAVCNALVTDTKAAQTYQSPRSCMCYVIMHAMQVALEDDCDIYNLQRILQDKPTEEIEHFFRQVVTAVECTGNEINADRSQHVERLKKVYDVVLSSSETGDTSPEGLQDIPLPNPNISFHLWTEEDQLWKELVLFVRPLSQTCEQDCLSQELDNFEIQDIVTECECCEQTRFSVLSTDSGIERDLPPVGEEPPPHCSAEVEHSRLQRKGGIKKKASPLEAMAYLQASCNGPGVKHSGKMHTKSGSNMESMSSLQRLHTARIVVLGDDRILGRLAQAFHSLRKRETRRVFLTTRLNLQFYYVPVVEGQQSTWPTEEHAMPSQIDLCEVAGYLGRADPWYESNINTLCHMIPKLATMPSSPSKHLVTNTFIIDVMSYYIRMGIQPVCFQVYSVKIVFSDTAREPAEDVFVTELSVKVQDYNPTRDLVLARKKTMLEGPGADITAMYRKVLLSSRGKELGVSLRSTGLVMKAIPPDEAEDLMCLNVYITEVIKTSNLSGRSFSFMTNKIRMHSIKVSSMDQKTFTLCLDKDFRRTYRNVVSVEVSPCLEPGYCLQKTRTMQFSMHGSEDVGLAKYMPKSLLLPINTFAGIIQ